MEIDQVAYPGETPNLAIEKRRRDLLPLWIKIFCWLFMISGGGALIGLAVGCFGVTYNLAFYGLETNQPLSWLGLAITIIFLVKGVAAYSLWTGKQSAIRLAEVDAIGGIIICCLVMLVLPFIDNFPGLMLQFRLELLLLIPYSTKLKRIDYYWEEPEQETIGNSLEREI